MVPLVYALREGVFQHNSSITLCRFVFLTPQSGCVRMYIKTTLLTSNWLIVTYPERIIRYQLMYICVFRIRSYRCIYIPSFYSQCLRLSQSFILLHFVNVFRFSCISESAIVRIYSRQYFNYIQEILRFYKIW